MRARDGLDGRRTERSRNDYRNRRRSGRGGAEFTNIFNRTEMSNPTPTNPLATPSINATTGQYTAGFGYINNGTTFSAARQGQLVGRFQF